MKFLSTFLALFLFINLNLAQSRQSRWSIGIVAGADITGVHRGISLSEEYSNKYMATFPSNISKAIVGPRAAIRVGLKLNHKLTLITGIGFNKQGERVVIDGNEIINNNPNDLCLCTRSVTTTRVTFLDFPVRLKYKIAETKWKWYIETGVSPSIYLDGFTQTKVDDNLSETSELVEFSNLRKLTTSFDLGFGIEKPIAEKLNLSIQPMARYYIPTVSDPENSNAKHFYNFGVEAGLHWKL